MATLTPEEFVSLDPFANFEHTAWRLESRNAYNVEAEAVPFRQWRSGNRPDQQYRQTWMTTVREAVAQGKRIERVRVVPAPLTDYLRFEAWLCKLNADAGEDIRYLDRSQARALGIPDRNYDYWLFDSHQVYLMRFSNQDRLEDLELIEDAAKIVEANRCRDAAWHYATPFHQWYPAHEHECEPEQRQASA